MYLQKIILILNFGMWGILFISSCEFYYYYIIIIIIFTVSSIKIYN